MAERRPLVLIDGTPRELPSGDTAPVAPHDHVGVYEPADASILKSAAIGVTVCSQTDSRLSNSREWTASTVTQAEAEARTATTRRAWTAQRVAQAIAAWWNASTAKSKLDGIASGATANATDAQLRDRSTHTGTQAASTITGLGNAAMLNVGAVAETVCAGNDSRLSDARTPTAHTHTAANISDSTTAGRALLTAADAAAQRTELGLSSASQAEMESGTETALRAMSPANVKQAIDALGGSSGAGAGNAALLEITANRQLLVTDARKLAISASSSGLRVNLPLASELDEDGQLWIIANTGAFGFDVMDYDNHTLGGSMGTIAPNQTRAFFLLDKTVGTWVVLDLLASSTAGRIGEAGYIIDPNTEYVFESAMSNYISIAALSDTKAIVAYRDYGNSSYGTACVLSISGTTITAGTPVVFESANSAYISVAALSDTKAIVAYRDYGNSSYGTACVLSISGTVITAGTPVVFESANSAYISVAALSDTKAIVAYQDYGNSSYGTACVLGIDGTVITVGDETIFNGAATNYTSVTSLSDLSVIVAYQDDGNSYYGTAQILERR